MNLVKRHVIILIVTVVGLLLSGYLSYMNIWGAGCSEGILNKIVSCGGPGKVLIWGQPTCVYGFGMYVLVFFTNLIAWSVVRARAWWGTLIGFGIAGVLFSGGLMLYELFVLDLKFTTLPACVYGFVLYAAILITAITGFRALKPVSPSTPS